MRIDKKLFWQVSNFVEAQYAKLKGGRGLLHSRFDKRDKLGMIEPRKSAKESVNLVKYWFDQKWYNICVFASFVMLFSNQNGIRFSVKWLVKCAKKEGYITGNGWSFLKAALKCAFKYGMLPYELMPDEIIDDDFAEYSRWTPECDKLLAEANKYKIGEYRRIDKEPEIIQSIDNGYLVFTALTWYSAMNRPQAPEYLLQATGTKIGGHAIDLAGHREYGDDLLNPQTFGQDYGNGGYAWIEDIFKSYFFDKYVVSKLSPEVRYQHFIKFNDGKMVRSKENPACYLIKNGKKYHVPTMELYWELKAKVGEKNVDEKVFQDMLDKVELGGDLILPNEQLGL